MPRAAALQATQGLSINIDARGKTTITAPNLHTIRDYFRQEGLNQTSGSSNTGGVANWPAAGNTQTIKRKPMSTATRNKLALAAKRRHAQTANAGTPTQAETATAETGRRGRPKAMAAGA